MAFLYKYHSIIVLLFFFFIHEHVDQQSPWIPARYNVSSASRSKGTAGIRGAFIGRRCGGERFQYEAEGIVHPPGDEEQPTRKPRASFKIRS